ncbi:dual specificity protein phosphatase 13B-like [Pelodytes ibericus]
MGGGGKLVHDPEKWDSGGLVQRMQERWFMTYQNVKVLQNPFLSADGSTEQPLFFKLLADYEDEMFISSQVKKMYGRMASLQHQYEPLPVKDLQRILWCHKGSTGHVNHVWPKLYLGDAFTARDKSVLRELGITHVLNAASGRYRINTGKDFYRDLKIDYYGVEADDDANFDLSIYFHPAAQFIRTGLQADKGKVLVHCAMGISRAASLVLAFLMISEGFSLVDALRTVSEHRDIFPNHGFLEQLRQLDIKLEAKKRSRIDKSKF